MQDGVTGFHCGTLDPNDLLAADVDVLAAAVNRWVPSPLALTLLVKTLRPPCPNSGRIGWASARPEECPCPRRMLIAALSISKASGRREQDLSGHGMPLMHA